jgi:hypothetical protein
MTWEKYTLWGPKRDPHLPHMESQSQRTSDSRKPDRSLDEMLRRYIILSLGLTMLWLVAVVLVMKACNG